MIDMCLNNAYVCFKQHHPKRKMKMKKFIRMVADDLVLNQKTRYDDIKDCVFCKRIVTHLIIKIRNEIQYTKKETIKQTNESSRRQ